MSKKPDDKFKFISENLFKCFLIIFSHLRIFLCIDRPPLSFLNLDFDSKSGVGFGIQMSFGDGHLVCFNLPLQDLCKEASYGSC